MGKWILGCNFPLATQNYSNESMKTSNHLCINICSSCTWKLPLWSISLSCCAYSLEIKQTLFFVAFISNSFDLSRAFLTQSFCEAFIRVCLLPQDNELFYFMLRDEARFFVENRFRLRLWSARCFRGFKREVCCRLISWTKKYMKMCTKENVKIKYLAFILFNFSKKDFNTY